MSDYCQIGVGQHRQGDVPVPAVPPPHLVLVQSHLPLGLLKTLLYGPAPPGHSHQFRQGRLRRAVADVIGQFLRLATLRRVSIQ